MQGCRPVVLFSLWGFQGDLSAATRIAAAQGFDGVEANLKHFALRNLKPAAVVDAMGQARQQLVLEVFTGGDYVPDLNWTPDQHLYDLAEQLKRAPSLKPLRVTVLTGSDSWPWRVQEHFWSEVMALIADCPIPVSFEIHRSRSFYSPWGITPFLETFPDLRLTADLSHWCVVSERLMSPDLAPIQAIAPRVDHVHARVGHAQGPSVGHPFAPEWQQALDAHAACWRLFRQTRSSLSRGPFTITPEFGPDGYLPQLPFTAQPVADLLEINTRMAHWLRQDLLW